MPEELISEEIIGILQKAGQDVADRSLDTTEYADILWFANQIRLNSEQPVVASPEPRGQQPDPKDDEQGDRDRPQPPITENEPESEFPPPVSESAGSISVENNKSKKKTGGGIKAPFQVPAATAIPNRREVARSLYPLHHKVPSRIQRTIDIAATIKRSAEEEFCVPVQKPASQRWLDVAVVIEKSPGYGIWQQTIKEFIGILQRQGAFRDVKCWFVTSKPKTHELILQSQSGSIRNPKELVLMGDRRLILVLSDCVTPGWLRAPKSGKQKDKELTPCWQDWLSFWGKSHPVTILQMLPAPFWKRTALGEMELLWLRSFEKGALNEKWDLETRKPWKDIKLKSGFPIPVVTLNPYSLNVWAKGTAGYSPTKTAGIYLKAIQTQLASKSAKTATSPEPDGEALFKQFMNTASLPARKLAALMSAVPVQLPIVRLIQRSMLRMDSTAVHVAEVFFSGILKRVNEEVDPEKRLYDFELGVRELLTQVIPASELAQVIDRISADIARRAGYSSVREFRAQLFMASKGAEMEGLKATPEMLKFARVALETLQRLGGEYAEFVERIESRVIEAQTTQEQPADEVELFWGQKLETYSFKTAQFVEEWADQEYEFEIAEFDAKQSSTRWEESEFETANIVVRKIKSQRQRAFDFRAFRRRVDPGSVLNIQDPKDRRFYIDFSEVRGDQVMKEIYNGIDVAPEKPTCHLLTGHIGCGKSTELLLLRHQLEQGGYFTVYFESTDYFEKADVGIIDVLLAIAICIDKSFTAVQLPPVKGLQGIIEKTKQVLNIPVDMDEFTAHALGLEASVTKDGALSIGVGFASIMARTKTDRALRKKLNSYLDPIKMELLRDINEELVKPLVNLAKEQGKQGLVVIVDNLDRVERGSDRNQQENLFIGQAEVLQGFACHMVYTMPLALRFGDRFGQITSRYSPEPKTLPMVRVRTKTGGDDPAGMAKMREMVLVRVFPDLPLEERESHIPEVFAEPESLERLCRVSGGHVRNLLQLLSEWVLKDWRRGKLTRETLEREIRVRRNNFLLGLNDSEYEMLREVHRTKTIGGDRLYDQLIANRLVFEYQAEYTSWFDLNPIILGADKLQDL